MKGLYLFFRWLVVLSITIFIGFFGGAGAMKLILTSISEESKVTQAQKEILKVAVTDAPIKNSQELEEIVTRELQGAKGQYGIYFENLQTGEAFGRNEERPYESASLYKLWVMATIFEQIEANKLQASDTVQQDIAVLNTKFRIASESAERSEGSLSLTVEEALEGMITVSDNYSALLLTEKVKLSTVASWLKRHGFTDSKVGSGENSPSTTPYETALFFKKLQSGELAPEEHTKAMLELLKRQKLNKKIPKYLPAGTAIAHKTGELGTLSHDGGIIYTPRGNYALVILTESSSQTGANERIANISSAVYKYVTER